MQLQQGVYKIMATYNNLVTKEFVKETRTDGTVTSLTIKMIAYDGDNNVTTFTGDGSYLVHDDSTWQEATVTGKTYYDWDNCTSIASQTMTYTVPAEDQTSLTQSTSQPHNHSEAMAYQAKRIAWREGYALSTAWIQAWTALYAAVEAL